MLPATIRRVRDDTDLDAVRTLFWAYAHSLTVDLSYQGFSEEVSTLPAKYAAPAGDLWLARDQSGEPLGCVGLRPLGGGACEMKRLYLMPSARGRRLGHRLVAAVVVHARTVGYREVRLDTLATMLTAIGLYEAFGFERCEPYYAPTPAGTVFMTLRL